MPNLKVTFNVKDNYDEAYTTLYRLRDDLHDALYEATDIITASVKTEARANMPVRSGKTQKTIESDIISSGALITGYVGSNDDVAKFLEEGTKPRKDGIYPKNKKALRFFVDGQEVIVDHVKPGRHEGTPEYAWLQRAGEAESSHAESIYSAEIESAFARAAIQGSL